MLLPSEEMAAMTATVQATCPGCRNVLRIPIDWAERALKCKKCGTAVQARRKGTPPLGSPIASEPTAVLPDKTPTATPTPVVPFPAYAPATEMPAAPPGYYGPPQYPAPQPGYGPPQYPPQGGYPQPGYGGPPQYPGYPYPQQPPGAYAPNYPFTQAPVVPMDGHFPIEDNDEASPRRGKYRRGGSSKWVGAIVVLILCGGLLGGGFYLMKEIEKNKQTKATPTNATPDVPNKTPGETKTGGLAALADPFPRRVLFVHISKYVYFNNIAPGSNGRGEDMPTRTANKLGFELRVPSVKENSQIFALTDSSGGKDFRPPIKSVVQQTFEQFFNTSRAQDRIAIYFGGHAVVIEDKAYLVPVEGEPDVAETLIPLDDFYAKLAACKAQQKVVMFDVCRFNPQFGAAKPGSEPMSAKLAELLHAPPPGIQVITSASAGENAQEVNESGSEFLTAFRGMSEKKKAEKAVPPTPDSPIPVAAWAEYLKAQLTTPRDGKIVQTVKLSGTESAAVPYNKDEPLATRFDWPTAPKGVNPDDVMKMIQLAATLPGIRKDLDIPPSLGQVYPFAADKMKDYQSDGVTDEDILKNGEKYPVRKATIEALNLIREKWSFGEDGLRESFSGAADDKLKKEIAAEQVVPAKLILALQEQLIALEAAGKMLEAEKSKKWLAMYQYALAQIQMRWAFTHEYDLALGNIRTDSVPRNEKGGEPVWRLITVGKMKSKKDVKEKADAARETLEKMTTDHKGTPWEVLAKMHKNVSLGLDWKLEIEEKKEEEKMEMKKE